MIPLDDAWVRECVAQSPGEAIDTQLLRLVRQQAPLATDDAVRGEVERLRSTLEGVGPLLEFLADPDVSDVLINGPGPAWVERSGRLVPTSVSLTSTDIDRLLQGVFHRTGRSLDRSHPIGDARLRDGTRISAVLSPLAVHGPVVNSKITGGSGMMAIRNFCASCHSLLFGTPEAAPDLVTIYAGSLDDRQLFTPQKAQFTRARQAWDTVPAGLPAYEEAAP